MDATIDQQVADLADWTREMEANQPTATAQHAPTPTIQPISASPAAEL
jgi:hypothetical protein